MNTNSTAKVTLWKNGSGRTRRMPLVSEEPLSIRVQGNPYAVVMRTPGDEIAHAVGFCLTEGIIDSPSDYVSIGFCDGEDTNVVTITLTRSRQAQVPEILDRRNFISQSSCGLCGKELVSDLYQILQPLDSNIVLPMKDAVAALTSLSDHQPLRGQTKASHAAALFDPAGGLLAVAEDVGRHNALDKAIGKVFVEKRLNEVGFAALSSRISYELVQKAARARIPVILAVSRPTALAVQLARKLNMTLASLADEDGLFVFSAEHRLSP
jgi:FdhD protein